jgi:ubiquinone/menaquinone biosynthesis C-methylase UbiE
VDCNLEDYYNNLDKIFSSAAPIYDEKIQANFINVGIREKEVDSVVSRYKEGWNVLEIGCGTGEEARKVINATGCNLTCIDVSKGMIDYSSEKLKKFGLGDKFRGVKMPAASVESLDGKFGMVYSFNGALNNEPQLEKFFSSLERVVESGGYFITSVRNRLSFAEFLVDLIRFRFRKLFARIGGDLAVEVVGQKIESHYFYNYEFLGLVPPSFRIERIQGLGIFAIPSISEKIKAPEIRAVLNKMEVAFTSVPPFNRLGDETLFVFRKI